MENNNNEVAGYTSHNTLMTTLIITIIASLLANMLFNYFVVVPTVTDKVTNNALETEYVNFGGKENYEKAMMVQRAQIEQQFGSMSIEEIQEALDGQLPSDSSTPDAEEVDSGEPQEIGDKLLLENKYVKGNPDAKITVYEHSDFNCGYCKRLEESGVMNQLLEEYGDNLNLVHRNRPVIGGENSMMKANAVMCIGEQAGTEAYYTMVNNIFTNNLNTEEAIVSAAGELGVDSDALSSCIADGKYNEELQTSIQEGANFGISGTPGTVVVNNETGEYKVVKGAAPYANFKDAVDSLIK